MKVGIPKEIKQGESRVGMTPAGVSEFVKHGHTVYVQHTAGDGSGFPDKEYEEAGASILPTMEEVYAASDMIVKVKEPIAPEYPLIRKDQIVFTYFHWSKHSVGRQSASSDKRMFMSKVDIANDT